MIALLSLVVGVLYTVGVYLILRRNMLKLIIGLALLGHGSNLLIFSVASPLGRVPPLLAERAVMPPPGVVDPVPQALILTAIVIGFGAQAFALILIQRTHKATGTSDLDRLIGTDT